MVWDGGEECYYSHHTRTHAHETDQQWIWDGQKDYLSIIHTVSNHLTEQDVATAVSLVVFKKGLDLLSAVPAW